MKALQRARIRRRMKIAGMLSALGLGLLLMTMAGRVMLPEMPFRAGGVNDLVSLASDVENLAPSPPDKVELASMTFGMLILVAALMWVGSCWMAGKCRIKALWLLAMLVVFVALSYVSAASASDRRTALNMWFQQATLILSGWLIIQMCTSRKRLAIVIAVLASLAGMMAVKGLYQYFSEIKDVIAHFEANKQQILASQGHIEGSPSAIAYENRLRTPTPTGFFALANPFASMLVVLLFAAAGSALQRCKTARQQYEKIKKTLKKGDVYVPALAGGAFLVMCVVVCAVVVLTSSEGAIFAMIAGLVVMWFAYRWREKLAAHWRRYVIAAALVICVGLSAVVAWGIANDRLPGLTMTFRWYYWTGAAEMVKENPAFGVGPGNFGSEYLKYRRAAAEEGVKTPHNFIAHALGQYGLPGGLCYVGMIAFVLVAVCKPRDFGMVRSCGPPRRGVSAVIIACLLVSVLLSLRLFSRSGGSDAMMLVSALTVGMGMLVASLVAFWWCGIPAVGSVTRVALACGVGAFVLHNLVTFSLWMPGPAMVFWVMAGAAVAHGGLGWRKISFSLAGPVGMGLCAIAIITSGILLWSPVAARQYNRMQTFNVLAARQLDIVALKKLSKETGIGRDVGINLLRASIIDNTQAALMWADRYASVDELDAISAMEYAKLKMALCNRKELPASLQWIRIAIDRDGSQPAYYHAAAKVLRGDTQKVRPSEEQLSEAIGYMQKAVSLDPKGMRFRIELAEMLLRAGGKEQLDEAGKHLDVVEEIDRALHASSVQHLSEKEREKINILRKQTGPAGK